MEIIKARSMGFCFGVRRALRLVEPAAPLESLGPLVHNRQVIEHLARLGVRTVKSLEELQGPKVAITSHGVGPQVLKELERLGFQVIDATCPFVRRAQRVAQAFANAKLDVVIFGDKGHAEVQGELGWTLGKGRATVSYKELLSNHHFRQRRGSAPDPGGRTAGNPSPPQEAWRQGPQRLGILSQTTQSPARFAHFVGQVVASNLAQSSELRVANTICPSTRQRQEEAIRLARKVDLMLVIGGRDSANTSLLAQTCAASGVQTYHVEGATEVQEAWLEGRGRVGITAGASTTAETIEEVVERLRELRERNL